MIAKVGTSTSIPKTVHYLDSNEERVSWKQPHNLASVDHEFVRGQMEATAAMSQTEQPVYHYSISWDPTDDPSKQQMIEVARQTLSDLGLTEHQALIVAHNDHDYKHLHVMANRVHPQTGTAWDRWMDYRKLEKSLRAIEREYGWKEVPGHHHQLEGQLEPEFGNSLNKLECAQIKRGELPFLAMVREVAEQDFRSAKHWMDLQNFRNSISSLRVSEAASHSMNLKEITALRNENKVSQSPLIFAHKFPFESSIFISITFINFQPLLFPFNNPRILSFFLK